jgi:hypothetical protein
MAPSSQLDLPSRASEARAKTRSAEAWRSSTTTATVRRRLPRRLSCSIGGYGRRQDLPGARVAELEPLDPEDRSSELAREPIEGGRAQAAAPDDYYLVVAQSYTPFYRARMLVSPEEACSIWIRSGSWRSTPPLTVISRRPFWKLALIAPLSMPWGSFSLRLKCP